jgi:hypothetical protein
MVFNPFRGRQRLRWEESERQRIAVKPKPPSIASKLATAWKVVLSFVVTAAVILVVVSTAVSAFNGTITLEPISTPKTMSEAGLTANVAALRLRDAIEVVAIKFAQAGESLPDIVQKTDLPDITVPNIGISVHIGHADCCVFWG